MPSESTEVRLVKLEIGQEQSLERLEQAESRLDKLEDNHQKQDTILIKLGESVDSLSKAVTALNGTVVTMNDLVNKVDKDLAITKTRFAILIALLSPIGASLIAIAVKFIFGVNIH